MTAREMKWATRPVRNSVTWIPEGRHHRGPSRGYVSYSEDELRTPFDWNDCRIWGFQDAIVAPLFILTHSITASLGLGKP
ncbi:MAG: hypothetical protein ACI9PP_000108, partial [Halobacteriales archaeon]